MADPRLDAMQPRAASDVPPGMFWAWRSHRTMAEVIAAERAGFAPLEGVAFCETVATRGKRSFENATAPEWPRNPLPAP